MVMAESSLRRARLAVLVALPPLITGFSGFLAARTEGQKRESAARRAEAQAWDEYGSYVTSQLHRDEALARALQRCRVLEAWTRPLPELRAMDLAAVFSDGGPQADVVLDAIARKNGWRPQ
jgi:hypothetical protein